MWNFNFLNLLTTYLPTLVFKISNWRLFGFLLFFGVLCFEGFAQVYDGTYTVTNQEQIDTFNFTEITGSLLIQNTDITNVDGFSELVSIGGNLIISNNAALSNIIGFVMLETASYFSITDNANLINIEGFNALTTIDNSFNIGSNESLTTISGFNSLNEVGNNNSSNCGSNCDVFAIEQNPNLTAINGFDALQTVNARFRIKNNLLLNSLIGFSALNYVISFEIASNPILQSVNNFVAIQTVPQSFTINNNAALSNIIGFVMLETASYFSITDNANLINIEGFNALTTIDNSFNIGSNESLTTISGFNSLNEVGNNNSSNCGSNCDVFAIEQNPNLTAINGFDALQTVNARFRIKNNLLLNSLIGFSALNYVISFEIASNPILQSVNNFVALQTVPQSFTISNNPSLCALTGFTSLTSLGSVNISQNEILNNCCILNCFDVSAVTTGSITIDNNARGCNSLNEVETLCPAEFCATPGCQIYDSINCGCPADCPNWPQAIFLNTGWNLISFDIVPSDNSIQNVFANIISDSNLEFVSTFNNGTVTFNPNLPTPFNTLQTISEGFGYWVKVTNATFLPVDGLCVDDSFRKPFEAGWNLVAFPPDESQPPADFFADLIANDNLEFVAGFDGGIKTFNPALPTPFQTLQQMENGFGYWVKVTNATN